MANQSFAFQSLRDFQEASRDELKAYLQSWGNVVRERDTRQALLRVAIENFECEGAGYGSVRLAA